MLVRGWGIPIPIGSFPKPTNGSRASTRRIQMFLSIGTPCRLAIGPGGKPVLVAHDGNRVALVALSASQVERLAQAAPTKEADK
jgi:hypothetical protein